MSLNCRRPTRNSSPGRTIEDRVEEKTSELQRAHDEVLHVETMASVGKMAAVVAHEINNPLSGILTYSKLIKKWVDNGSVGGEKKQEAQQCLDLISSESKRCGELVKNLLTFSRQSPMNVAAHRRQPPGGSVHHAGAPELEGCHRAALHSSPTGCRCCIAIPPRSSKSCWP